MIVDHFFENSGQYLFFIITLFFIWQSSKWVTACQKIKESKEKRIVIENVVRAVDRLYHNEIGLEKLARARDLSMRVLAGYPIDISTEELTIYIESAVSKIQAEDSYYYGED